MNSKAKERIKCRVPFYARHSHPRDSIPQAYQDNPLDIHRTSHFAGICLRLPVEIVRYQNPPNGKP